MKASELKKAIESCLAVPTDILFDYLNRYHIFLSKMNFSRSCQNTLFFTIDYEVRLVQYNDAELLIRVEGKDKYQLLGLPLSYDVYKVRDMLGLCLELGVGIDLSDSDSERMKYTPTPDLYMDSYLYDIDSMQGYFRGCSRSTRKNINRFERDFKISIYKSNSVPEDVKLQIPILNEIWLKEFKDGDSGYSHMINATSSCLESVMISHLDSAVIVYRDLEDNIVAYDYFEVWGDTVYALGGKSIIKDLSAFKVVNRNVMYTANELFGATKMDIGYSNSFTVKSLKPKEHAVHLSEAKASFPNVKAMYSMFLPSPRKYKLVDIDDNSQTTLF